jgi:hypothetical protein
VSGPSRRGAAQAVPSSATLSTGTSFGRFVGHRRQLSLSSLQLVYTLEPLSSVESSRLGSSSSCAAAVVFVCLDAHRQRRSHRAAPPRTRRAAPPTTAPAALSLSTAGASLPAEADALLAQQQTRLLRPTRPWLVHFASRPAAIANALVAQLPALPGR